MDSFQTVLADGGGRLEAIAGRIAAVTTASELAPLLGLLAAELGADEVRVLDAGAAPPQATLRSDGFTLPIPYRDRIVGHLAVYSREPRTWSRFELGRARLVGYQLGPILGTVSSAV